MDNVQKNLEIWCSGEGISFNSEVAREAYKARAKRVTDVIQLKVPDRVPVVPSFGMFPALDNGITCEDAMFDYDKATQAWLKTLKDFEPDLFLGSRYAWSGPLMEALDYKQLRLPGREVSAKHIFQFVEKEYVTADEFYDHFMADPSDFMLRVYLPRTCGILGPLKNFPPLSTWFGYYISVMTNMISLGTPEIHDAFETLLKAGTKAMEWSAKIMKDSQKIRAMGYPSMFGGQSAAPFDIIGDWFRGTRGSMLDMYREPERLTKAMEKLVPILIEMGSNAVKSSGNPIVSFMLHKGPEGFMSLDQYKTFYWPTLRKVMLGLIDKGCVPAPLFEGDYTSRLEIIKDIPKGKAMYWFETVDFHKAKEILGDTVCFRGNVPITLLHSGTTEQVKDYVKSLIDVVGKGGGLMVDCGIWFDEAKHNNVKTMIDFTKEYGVYN
ncbi:MAG: uroporphyrinogen decarboxylase family protein [Thermodesulfobacteriota bacterium]|nr:uroporphyrinogen decarboxylase family protein [Thermodesulfobacteriota bacterium]